jgi:hypothetical protein
MLVHSDSVPAFLTAANLASKEDVIAAYENYLLELAKAQAVPEEHDEL